MKKKSVNLKRVGLLANPSKSSISTILRKAFSQLQAAGCEVLSDEMTGALGRLDCRMFPNPSALARNCDLILVFGGDGTMLRAVREIQGATTPILGVNVGRLGFLTAVTIQKFPEALDQIWAGEFRLERRPIISAGISSAPGELTALNDFVISRGASRMIELEVEVNGEILTRYRGDGLIVSSPTGSTAYSLSAGGAIVSPSAPVFAITPICPHTLSNRSVIVGLTSRIAVRVLTERLEVTLTADGQVEKNLRFQDEVVVRQSRRYARLLHLNGSSFFDTLRRKLHWSGSNV